MWLQQFYWKQQNLLSEQSVSTATGLNQLHCQTGKHQVTYKMNRQFRNVQQITKIEILFFFNNIHQTIFWQDFSERWSANGNPVRMFRRIVHDIFKRHQVHIEYFVSI